MPPRIYPLECGVAPDTSARAVFERTRRLHAGTLNIFAESNDCSGLSEKQQTRVSREPSGFNGNHSQRGACSSDSKEFGWPHLRRVRLPRKQVAPQGIHQVPSAAAKAQNIQVVGVTDDYKDPSTMKPRRAGVRCFSRNNSSSMSEIMHHDSGEAPSPRPYSVDSSAPGSRCGSRCSSVGRRRLVEYTPLERFSQAVRDHVQRRRGGITEFYVNLARGRVGTVVFSTPASTPRPWKLEEGPVTHTLTLGSCLDQLQSLTGMSVTMNELAEMVWGKEKVGEMKEECNDEEELAGYRVTYRDFSVAFGDSPLDGKFETFKI
ncbi:unnamed protein product [Trypanosoma congolense IL3000]|uniref:WGS project CAEQ00000000 data, annotated contig 2042 n=1 Tax=Trypanosoma congolense (strain IL3000) TaxID=1068625 RepID=F9WB04_TRYCI|nr:unnamed protein product [Trypanosoma congolense IL3000]